ncbi:TPA: MASE1 domain-containing protein [Yersinia enterocolitica]|nr:MASE1 domain-containing protein [Yersinia enterocolitica]HDM8354599.1 MASE1 domain-containing protein [Yersinia enterocolitica]
MKPPSILTQKVIPIVIWSFIYYLSGVISLKFDDPASHISIVWFPAGVATAAFLCARWHQWPVLLGCFVIINLALDNSIQENYLLSICYAMLSMPSTMLIAWIVRYYSRQGDDLHVVLMWIFSTIIVSLLDALFFSLGFVLFNRGTFQEIFWVGFVADVTGIFFATTVIMGFFNTRFRTHISPVKNRLSGSIIWVMLCLLTLLTFNNSLKEFSGNILHLHNDMLIFTFACLPIILAVMLSISWGNLGGSIALLTLATIVIYFTGKGYGPFFINGLHHGEPLLLVQCYLTATALLMVFLRALTRSTHHFDETDGVQHAVYQLNLSTGEIEWGHLSGELVSIDPAIMSNMNKLIEQIHPDDRNKVLEHWCSSDEKQNLPRLDFRFNDQKGTWVTITDSESILFSHHEPRMIIGNWHITNSEPLFKAN